MWLANSSRLVRDIRFLTLLKTVMPPAKADILVDALRNYFSNERNAQAGGNHWDDFDVPGLVLILDRAGPRFEGARKEVAAALTAEMRQIYDSCDRSS